MNFLLSVFKNVGFSFYISFLYAYIFMYFSLEFVYLSRMWFQFSKV